MRREADGQMRSEIDVLVVGGGVIGVAACEALARRGRAVVLVEGGAIGKGCSYGNAGLVVPSHAVPLASPGALGDGLRWLLRRDSPFYVAPRLEPELALWLFRFWRAARPERVRRAIPALRDLGRASQARYRELARSFDFGYEERGWTFLFRDGRALAAAAAEARLLAEFGIASEVLDGASAHARVPEALPGLAGALVYPEDAQLVPDQFVRVLARLAQGAGAELRPATPVLRLERNGHSIARVVTAAGTLRPREVVLAAGSWSARLARQVGVRVPVQPARGYSLTLPAPGRPSAAPLYLTERKVALTRWEGALRASGTLELAGLDAPVDRRRVAAIARAVPEYLAGFADFSGVEPWAGLRPASPDGLPIIGRSRRVANLIVATGHGMLGMTQGPATGELVARIVCDEPASVDLAPFGLERFV
ncbi:MAG: FAD-dependent oxidoreductase [Acidobacteria bacterium]|nr:MAG: FAD-dependent oxidoreductase [Acidobacteriota bacterium]